MCKVFEDFQCTIDVTWRWGVYDVSANPGTRSPANLMQVRGLEKMWQGRGLKKQQSHVDKNYRKIYQAINSRTCG